MQGFSYSQMYQALQDWPVEASTLYLANINRLIYLGELRLVRDLDLELFDVTDTVTVALGATTIPKPAQSQTITFTATIAKGATSATLSANWTGTTGVYLVTFSDGEVQAVTLTNAANTATWPLAMAAAVTSSAVIAPQMLVERDLWIVYSGAPKILRKRSYAFTTLYQQAAAGQPIYYCDDGTSTWQIAPPADANVSAAKRRYIKRPESLVTAGNTWLGDNVGDCLFVACLMETEQFLKADDRYADMRTKYYQELVPAAKAEISTAVRSGKYSPLTPVAGLPAPPAPAAPPPQQ